MKHLLILLMLGCAGCQSSDYSEHNKECVLCNPDTVYVHDTIIMETPFIQLDGGFFSITQSNNQ